jgi:hypothetical protein
MMLCSGRMDIGGVRVAPPEQAFGKSVVLSTRGEGGGLVAIDDRLTGRRLGKIFAMLMMGLVAIR